MSKPCLTMPTYYYILCDLPCQSLTVNVMQPLMEAGINSLGAVELRNALSSQLTLELPATLIFDYPTIGALSVYLAAHATAPGPPAPITSPLQRGLSPEEAEAQISGIVSGLLGTKIPPDQVQHVLTASCT